ncbi:MAG: hypothetical protein ACFFDM_11555 [Candidatus Thorarchaeota archaeon]
MSRDGTISWGKVGRPMNGSNSLAFMEIRLRSIRKALAEVKNKRFNLEQELRHGTLPESEYASSLLKLIVESNNLTKEQEDVAERIKSLKNKSLVEKKSFVGRTSALYTQEPE